MSRAKVVTEFEVEYVWLATDGHARSFVETYDEPDEARGRARFSQLRAGRPGPGETGKGSVCETCRHPRRIVVTLRKRKVWLGEHFRRVEVGEELETWEWEPERVGAEAS